MVIMKVRAGNEPSPTEVPGTVLSIDDGITVRSADGSVRILECAEVGGEPAPVEEIAHRLGVEVGTVLGG